MSCINKCYDQVIFAFPEISQRNHPRWWSWCIRIPQCWSVSPVLLLFEFGFLQDRFLEVFVLLIFSVPRVYYYRSLRRSCMCVSFSLWTGPRALPQTAQRAQEGKTSRLNAIAAVKYQMTKWVQSHASCCNHQELLFSPAAYLVLRFNKCIHAKWVSFLSWLVCASCHFVESTVTFLSSVQKEKNNVVERYFIGINGEYE